MQCPFIRAIYEDQTGYVIVRRLKGYDRYAGQAWFTPSSLGGKDFRNFVSPFSPDYPFNVYFGVLPRQVPIDDQSFIETGRTIWVDVDSLERLSPLLLDMPLPSITVSTGHGYHHYWLLTESINANDIESINRGLQKKLGGDFRAVNRGRILRLPCTWNTKEQPFLPVEIIDGTWLRYPPSLFEEYKMEYKIASDERALEYSNLQPGLFTVPVNVKFYLIYGYPQDRDRSEIDFKIIEELIKNGATVPEVKEIMLDERYMLASDTRIGLNGRPNGLLYRKPNPEWYIEHTYYQVLKLKVVKHE